MDQRPRSLRGLKHWSLVWGAEVVVEDAPRLLPHDSGAEHPLDGVVVVLVRVLELFCGVLGVEGHLALHREEG